MNSKTYPIQNKSSYLSELDGWRGFLMLLVLMKHLDFTTTPRFLDGGHPFDSFMMLGGYLVTAGLLREYERKGKISPINFYISRGLRIMPSILVLIAGTVCFVWLWDRGAMSRVLNSAMWAFLHCINWPLALNDGAPALKMIHFTHLWSVTLMNQFYLIWAFVMYFVLKKGGVRYVLYAALIFAFGSWLWRVFMFLYYKRSFGRIYFGLDTHMDSLAWGCALAAYLHIHREKVIHNTHFFSKLSFLALIGIVAYCIKPPNNHEYILFGSVSFIWLTGVITVDLIYNEQSRLRHYFKLNSLVYFGIISYSVYLWHFLVIIFLGNNKASHLLMQFGLLILSTLLGFFAYIFIEQPSQNLKQLFSSRKNSPFSRKFIFLNDRKALFKIFYAPFFAFLIILINDVRVHEGMFLKHAARYGNSTVAQILLWGGSDIDAHDKRNRRTPLLDAAMFGNTSMVKLLLDRGASIQFRDEKGETSLMKAVQGGHIDVVRLLLERGADANLGNYNGYTPLLIASRNGREDIIDVLIEKGADINKANEKNGWTALMEAAWWRRSEAFKTLIERKASSDSYNNAMMFGVERGNLDVIQLLLDKGVDVNLHDERGRSLLEIAVESGHIDVAATLIRGGAHVNDINRRNGWTPVMKAIWKNRIDMVQFLIKHNADINYSNNKGETALLLAAKANYKNILQMLFTHGVNISFPNEKGYTPLMIASKNGWLELTHTLIDAGADINAANKNNGWTPLMEAAWAGHFDIVNILLKKGAKVGIKDMKGETAIQKAANRNKIDILKLLLSMEV